MPANLKINKFFTIHFNKPWHKSGLFIVLKYKLFILKYKLRIFFCNLLDEKIIYTFLQNKKKSACILKFSKYNKKVAKINGSVAQFG